MASSSSSSSSKKKNGVWDAGLEVEKGYRGDTRRAKQAPPGDTITAAPVRRRAPAPAAPPPPAWQEEHKGGSILAAQNNPAVWAWVLQFAWSLVRLGTLLNIYNEEAIHTAGYLGTTLGYPQSAQLYKVASLADGLLTVVEHLLGWQPLSLRTRFIGGVAVLGLLFTKGPIVMVTSSWTYLFMVALGAALVHWAAPWLRKRRWSKVAGIADFCGRFWVVYHGHRAVATAFAGYAASLVVPGTG